MGKRAVSIMHEISARGDAQTQKGGHQIERDETRASANHFAVVNLAAGGERILEPPGHHDGRVMLDMLGQRRFAAAFDSLAQARHTESGGEGRAETRLVDEGERGTFTFDAASWQAAKMVIAMALKTIKEAVGERSGRFGARRDFGPQRFMPRGSQGDFGIVQRDHGVRISLPTDWRDSIKRCAAGAYGH